MKRIIAIILMMSLLVSMTHVVYAEDSFSETANMENRKEEILKNYREQLIQIQLDSYSETGTNARNINEKTELKLEIQAETVKALNEIGYEAYDVNPQTFKDVEEILHVDLNEVGLSEEGAYLITINEDSFIYPDAETGDPYTYTYAGTTYTLRSMTVRVTDDPDFEKFSRENVLDDNSRDVIMNCLDTAIGLYVGSIWEPLGTVASLLGLSISDFWVSYSAYLDYNATSTWTRVYRQVWDDHLDMWVFGCYVEIVEAATYLNGWYYDSSLHTKKSMVTETEYNYFKSDKYHNTTWKNSNAVLGYLNSCIYPNNTSDVEYYYDGSVIITHPHNF